ncbi:hypothetical protein QE447_002307 [Stenotrophomonas sp. SORGH_AS282]|nr:hypothetical protein [Stenotrophomonas sp. SORGH_AS_0282]
MPELLASSSSPSARVKSPLPSDSSCSPSGTCWLSTPGLHHERVVDRHAEHVDAAVAERGEVLHEAGQVLGRAGRGEGAGHAEQHRLAAVEQGMGIQCLHALADALEGDFGNAVANVDGHGSSWFMGKRSEGRGRAASKR